MADTAQPSAASSTAASGRRRDPAADSAGLPPEQMVTEARPRLPRLALALMLAIVTPLWFFLGDFLLTPTRVICVIAIPILTLKLLAGAYGRIMITDVLMFFYSFWVILAHLVNNGMSAFVFASLQVSLLLGGYLVGRATIRSPADMQALGRVLARLVIVLLPIAFIETQSGDYVIPQWIRNTGFFGSVAPIDYGERLGLFRAQVVFAHPIHFGLYCSTAISLYFVSLTNKEPLTKRLIMAGLILGSVFMSVSSGPFLASVFQLALIGYMLVTRHLNFQWPLLLTGFGIFYAIIEVASDRFGLYALASRLAFNSGTAFYRSLIWRYGTEQVERTPIFGVGRNPWVKPRWMTDSIDNFWLQISVTNGLPAGISMIALFLITIIFAGRGHYVRGTDAYYARVGYTFLFVSLMLSLATVTIWNEVLCMIMFLLGAGGYMLQAKAPQTAAADADVSDAGGGGRVRRTARGTPPERPGRAPAPDRAAPVFTRFPDGQRPDRNRPGRN